MQLYFATVIPSPVGSLLAIADDNAVRFVQFVSVDLMNEKINYYQKLLGSGVALKINNVLDLLRSELDLYFVGKLQKFTVPIVFAGTVFQQATWNTLQKIPHAQTVSYAQVAVLIGNPKAMRAVGSANGANPLMILIPCHRVIKADGDLGGYAGGIDHKRWLLSHEKKYEPMY